MKLLLIFAVGFLYFLYGVTTMMSGSDVFIFVLRGDTRLENPEELWAGMIYFGLIGVVTVIAGMLLFARSYPDHPLSSVIEKLRLKFVKWNRL